MGSKRTKSRILNTYWFVHGYDIASIFVFKSGFIDWLINKIFILAAFITDIATKYCFKEIIYYESLRWKVATG